MIQLIHFPVFDEWYNTKILSPWPNVDYISVLVETTNENLLILSCDISPILKPIGKMIYCKNWSA